MGTFVKGEVVVLPFPFSDLTTSKRRPAFVVAPLSGDDVILCMITSQMSSSDPYAIPITDGDFVTGTLKRDSLVRPARLFTADSNIVEYSAGRLSSDKVDEVIEALITIIR